MVPDASDCGSVAALGFVGFTATHLHQHWIFRQEAPAAAAAIGYATAIGTLLHELHRERGSSALFIGSAGQQFRTELQSARSGLDAAVLLLDERLRSCRAHAILGELAAAAADLRAMLDRARAARPGIDRLELTTQQSFTNWTAPVRLALAGLQSIGYALRNPELLRGLDAYLALLEGLEKSAQERATGSGALAAGRFEPAAYQRFVLLAHTQAADIDGFRSRAGADQIAFLDQVMTDPVFAELQQLRTAIHDGVAKGTTGGIAAPHWFAVTSRRISEINRVRDRVAADLKAACDRLLGEMDDRLARSFARALRLAMPLAGLFALLAGCRRQLAELRHRHRDWTAGDTVRHAAERDRHTAAEAQRLTAAERGAGETVAAAEIAGLVNRIVAGDLDGRLSETGKEGFFADVSRQLNRLAGMLQAMVGELAQVTEALGHGDLSRTMDGDYGGIFGQLKDSTNRMAALLRDFSQRLADSAASVRTAALDIAAGSEDLSQRTEGQASSLEQTAAAMHQVTATVKQNAENARAADRLAGAARDTAAKGGRIVADAVGAMDGIEQSAQKIADIVSLIDEIAFQTNLLALNASVEAARAGEAGKGFAVVAQEVRALAQRSANASKDIKGLITDSNTRMRAGTQLVGQTGTALEDIVGAVKKLSDIIAEIAAASGEQARGLEEVNGAVADMDEATQRNAALVEQTTASARSLSTQAGELAKLVGFFRG